MTFMFVSCINLRKRPHRSTQIWCFCLFSGRLNHRLHVCQDLCLFPLHFVVFCFYLYTNFSTSAKRKNFFEIYTVYIFFFYELLFILRSTLCKIFALACLVWKSCQVVQNESTTDQSGCLVLTELNRTQWSFFICSSVGWTPQRIQVTVLTTVISHCLNL